MGVKFWAWASVVANIGIMLTGALVRLTGSGLGCPTWPRCTEESFTPHSSLGIHGAIEFGNRLLTYVLAGIAIATFVAVWRWSRTSRSLRWHAAVVGLAIPLQGVIGGITVLTDLNPWVVAFHLLVSMAIVGGAIWLVIRVTEQEPIEHRGPVRGLVVAVYAVTWIAVYLGTIVTGSGPHAGDEGAARNDLDPATWSHIHAWSVWVLVALTIALVVAVRHTTLSTAAGVLLVIELCQGLIGYVQYFTGLPIALVAAHLVGAGTLLASATWVLVKGLGTSVAGQPIKGSAAAATKSNAR